MSALATDFTGLGMAPAVAQRMGWTVKAITGAGTAQGGSSPTVYAGDFARLTTASGQTAATLDSAFPVGGMAWVANITATAGLLFPPSGCKIDNGSDDASTSIAQNKGRLVFRASPTLFYTILGG